MSEDQPRT